MLGFETEFYSLTIKIPCLVRGPTGPQGPVGFTGILIGRLSLFVSDHLGSMSI